jgi:hypothetical protein
MDCTRHMSPFSDAAFKRFFGQEENKLILIDFLLCFEEYGCTTTVTESISV